MRIGGKMQDQNFSKCHQIEKKDFFGQNKKYAFYDIE
jgi:hypothetical protein